MANKSINKIIVFSQTFGLGGAESFLTDLLVELKKQGVDVEVFANYPRWQTILIQNKIKVTRVPFDLDIIGDWKGLVKAILVLPYAVFFYGRIINNSSVNDCFLFPSFGDKILGSFLANFFHKKIIWIEFGPLSSVFKKFANLPKYLYVLVKDYPQVVITSSNHSCQKLKQEVKFKLPSLQVIPCGRSLPTTKSKFSTHHGMRIVCISRLEPGKGQDLLIKAMAKIYPQLPQASLKIVGEGAWYKELTVLSSTLGLESCITFTGRVDNAWKEIEQADVIVCPSMWELEGFGMVAIEAMALAKPVVGFNRGPTNEIVIHGQTGLLAEPGNINDLAKQILKLLKHPEQRKIFGQQGQKIFQQRYTIPAVASQYQQAICRSLTT
jgi:glycosyltransferase involved in cell wall biosynthesis